MKLSARNQLSGVVTAITPGAVNAEVTIGLPGGQVLVSVVTLSAIESLGLAVGKPVVAIIKASTVMLGVE